MEKIKSLSLPYFYVYSTIAIIILIYVYGYILSMLNVDISNENPIDKYPKELVFFLSVIIGPALETLIYQYLPYKVMEYFNLIKHRRGIYSLFIISTLFFALSHPYSLAYIIYAFFMGLLFIVLFYISYNIRKDKYASFWLLTLIHMIINTLVFFNL